MNFPYDERQNDIAAKVDESYYRRQRIQDAHQIIESLSETRREPPVEVQQAHLIGTLEADLRNASREISKSESRLNQTTEELIQARASLNSVQLERNNWRIRALDAERLYENLKARKKTAVKK